MITKFTLVINNKGAIRTVKNIRRFTPKANEIAMAISVSVPDILFKRPVLTGSITIPNNAEIKEKITSDVEIKNLESSIKEYTGMEVKLSIVQEEAVEEKT